MRASFAARWTALLAVAERRLPALTRLKRPEALPIVLHRRRIYVVPTRFGLTYSGMLIVMLLGALNYSNNPAILLTCLLGAATYQSIFAGFRSLNRIELRAIKARACYVGESLRVSLHFDSAQSARHALRLRMENAVVTETEPNEIVFDVPADDGAIVEVSVPALRRGWQQIGRVRVWSEYPFGVFHVWSWLHPAFQALVYPRAETNPPPLPEGSSNASTTSARRTGDELSMLRDYHPSDPRRLIAWKASARHDRLLVKEFERPQSREIVLDWVATEGVDYETRISRLTAWVERTETLRTPYTLQLPLQRIGPGLGVEHQQACLRALALLPEARR